MELEQIIKQHIYNLSNSIWDIKRKACKDSPVGHIYPKSKRFYEYIGRKRQVTMWLIALHLNRGDDHKTKCHTSRRRIINMARKMIEKLKEETICV